MATDATGSQPRKPPPAPSTRASTTRQSSVRPARRMSNHPRPLAGLGGSSGTSGRPTLSVNPAVGSITTSANPTKQASSIPTGVVRDELVRAVMPELRLLMQHLVDAAVERSLAPLLDKQRELEASLKDLRTAQIRAEQLASSRAQPAPGANAPTGAFQAEARPFAAPATPIVTQRAVAPVSATVVERPAATARTDVWTTSTYDANTLADIPSELNGSRRKRVVIWTFALIMVALLLSAVGLSVLSNMGTYF